MNNFTQSTFVPNRKSFSKFVSILGFILLLLYSAFSFGQSAGFNTTYLVLNVSGGGNTYYDLQATTSNPDFDGNYLGAFCQGDTSGIVFKGAEHNVYKCGGCDLTSTRLYYRIYVTGSPTGSFISNSIGYSSGFSNGCGGEDQQWSDTGFSTNLLSGLTAGNYTIEVYSDATVTCSDGTVYASNDGGNYAATFTVNPTLTASVSIGASATTICSGTSVTFTATPTHGGTSPSYQWQINGTDVSGETGTTYTTTALTNSDVVTVVMTSNDSPCLTGSPATSNGITMTVNPNLTASVSIGASDTTICAGTSVTFTATPTHGGTSPSYQWQINGTDISGETGTTYTTTALTDTDVVTVVMTSNASPCLTGSPATSDGITMTVNPTLTASVSIGASDTTICAGTSVTFTATPTHGGTSPSYQWQINGTDVSGETGTAGNF